MKQILQRYDNGRTELVEVPVPVAAGVHLVVQAHASLISAGTERSVIEVSRANLLEKARKRPDQVKRVLAKVRTDGISSTVAAVQSKLGDPFPLGYCSAGVVVAAGSRVRGFAIGDRVVSNGPHAEYVRVPQTLTAHIPAGVSSEHAAFAPAAAIALQGIRIAAPTLGETVVVYGLGLIGLLAVQLLRANGCRVIGIDPNPARLELAEGFGARVLDARAQDVVGRVLAETNGVGADAVLLTLASSSDQPAHEAALMSRQRGRMVLVGVTGLKLQRDDFYRKELSFAVSCSYGPGRYDASYEEGGNDYPIGFVRWTEQRNFEAVLHLMATGVLDPAPLITHRFPFYSSEKAYSLITSESPSLGVVLEYNSDDSGCAEPRETTVRLDSAPRAALTRSARPGTAALIGAGVFARRVLIPEMRNAGFLLRTVASTGGTSAAVAGRDFGFEQATTDLDVVFSDPQVDTLFVLTRHDSHAALALKGLRAGKHVFVEKPLALCYSDLREIEAETARSGAKLTVGFNRRFAPLTRRLVSALRNRTGPVSLIISVNAGSVPRDHWTQDPDLGGGRIVGEACHFIDLARAVIGSEIADGNSVTARDSAGRSIDDNAHLSLRFADGSTAVVHYLSIGSHSFPKERVEAFWDGRTFSIDNWRGFREYGETFPRVRLPKRQDKGHAAEMQAWHAAILQGSEPPIPLSEIFEVSRWALRLSGIDETE